MRINVLVNIIGGVILIDVGIVWFFVDMLIFVSICKVNKYIY